MRETGRQSEGMSVSAYNGSRRVRGGSGGEVYDEEGEGVWGGSGIGFDVSVEPGVKSCVCSFPLVAGVIGSSIRYEVFRFAV